MTKTAIRIARRLPGRIIRNDSGTAIIEMAIAAPLLLTMLMGIIAYGDWFLTAHTVQEAVNDAARATLGGLTSSERQQLAVAAGQNIINHTGVLNPANSTFNVSDNGQVVTVTLVYNAATDPLFNLPLVPLPTKLIQRSAAIELGAQ